MEPFTVRSTTILGVRVGKKIALGGDGQVTMGDMQMKSKAIKVRSFCDGKILAGFAGAVADAMALFEKFEGKLTEVNGNLQKAVVEMAKDWRTDKILKDCADYMGRGSSYHKVDVGVYAENVRVHHVEFILCKSNFKIPIVIKKL